ncbi:MAG: CoA transferase [Betaproteobacteria bacterium]|nr:CoA transferase [Betaproteobacteria bacterium]
MNSAAPHGPLDAIRVLDFTNMLSGPYCTRLLADLGAEVIKVEPPAGDHNRSRRPVRNGYSSFFGHLNCGKKSIVLDLKTAAGRDAAAGLAAKSDIIVENWRPGVADRLGVGYAQVVQTNAGVIYCSISGFGQTGPNAQRPAYAPIVHAASGFDLAQVDYQGGGRPANTATFIADVFGGMSAFGAVQTALYNRKQTGKGQYIDVALMDAMLNLLVYECQEAQAPTSEKIRVYQPLKTLDGYVVAAPTSQKNFEQLARTVGHPEWIQDPRFAKTRTREANWSELMGVIEQWTQTRSGEECESALLAGGVPCTRYRTVDEAMNDAQMQARGGMTRVKDRVGEYWVPNAPFQMPGLHTAPRPHVPELGESTVEVLVELLGYTPQQARACSGDAVPAH